jgi:hypothetical protein
MIRTYRYRSRPWLGLAVVLLAATGCGGGSNSYSPSEDQARTALEKALTAWKNGKAAGKVQGESPAIQALDSVWQQGARLASFQIVGTVEKEPAGPRWFSVKLKFQDETEPQQVTYAVLGVDPLWVYREKDYIRACGME